MFLDRRKLSVLLLLAVFVFSGFSSLMVGFSSGENWLWGWSYRKSHVISHASGSGTDYQVKMTVHYSGTGDSGGDVYCNSLCQTNFGDVRFTGSDGSVLLDYWMQNMTVSSNAVFWVEVADDLSSADVTIYIYYGNAAVSSTSNFYTTFVFGDPFDSSSLNTTTWTSVDGNPTYSIDTTQKCLIVTNLDVNSNNGKGFHSRTFTFPAHYIAEDAYGTALTGVRMDLSDDAQSNLYFGMLDLDNGAWNSTIRGIANAEVGDWWASSYGKELDLGVNGADDWYMDNSAYGAYITWRALMKKKDDNFNLYHDGTLGVTEAPTHTPTLVHIGLSNNNGFGNFYLYAFRIRAYVEPEPTNSNWGAQESAPLVVVGEFQAPSAVYVHTFNFLNESISDSAGYGSVVNATMTLKVAATTIGTLLWISVSNTFSIYDNPNGYVKTVDNSASERAVVNATSLKLSWSVEFEWNTTVGTVDLTEAKCYDNLNDTGTASKAGFFTLFGGVDILNIGINDPDRVNPNQYVRFTFQVVFHDNNSLVPTDFVDLNVTLYFNSGYSYRNSTAVLDGSLFVSSGYSNLSCNMESAIGSYTYSLRATALGVVSSYFDTSALIVDRVEATFAVDNPDVPAGEAANFTTTWKSEYDGSSLVGIHYDVYRNGTFWHSLTANFADSNTAWIDYTYHIEMTANNYNLTDIVAEPSNIPVLWFGTEAVGGGATIYVNEYGVAFIMLGFGVLFGMGFCLVAARHYKRRNFDES